MRVAMLLVAVACGNAPPAPAEQPRPPPPPVTIDAAVSPVEGYVDQPGPQPERRTLATGSSSFKSVVGKPRKLAAVYLHTEHMQVPVLPTRVLVETGEGAGILDPTTGRVTKLAGKIVDTGRASRTAVLSQTVGDREVHRLFHLDSGRVIEPRITVPDGKVVDWMIATVDDADLVWVVAKSATGKVFHGRWVDLAQAGVSLSTELPYWPDYIHSDHDMVRAGKSACDALQIIAPGTPRCEPGNHSGAYVGGDRWIVKAELVDATTTIARLMTGCPVDDVHVVGARVQPPAIFTTCGLDSKTQPFELWSPQRRWRWSEVIEAGNDMPPPDPSPILLVDLVGDSLVGVVTRWLDVDRAIIFSSPPLTRVAATAKHVLAISDGEPGALWHLDFDRGEIVRIGDAACRYRSVDAADSRVLIDCPTVNSGGELASTDETTVELIDLAARTRTVVTGLIGGRLLPRGALLVSRFYDAAYVGEMKRQPMPGETRRRPVPKERYSGLLLLP